MSEGHLFEYVAWFRDKSMAPNDQDYEWPGVIYIYARNREAALSWGDHLARTCDDIFLWSKAEPHLDAPPIESPITSDGEELTATQIGW